MQSRAKFVFLGVKSFEGKKEKTRGQLFYSLNLLQGAETYSVFLENGQNVLFEECDLYDGLDMEVNTFVKSDRGIPALGLRILKIYSITSYTTGEIISFEDTPNLSPVPSVGNQSPAAQEKENKSKTA